MDAEIQKEFSVNLLNRPGALGGFDTSLGRAGINILGYLLQAHSDTGVLRFLTDAPDRAEQWLSTGGHSFKAAEVLVVPVDPRPGFVGEMAVRLGESGVNIEASYPATLGGRQCVVFAVDALDKARGALGLEAKAR